jgi:hypothetical protein
VLPVLRISDGCGNLDTFAWAEILALTAYPSNEVARREFATVVAFHWLVQAETEEDYTYLLGQLATSIPALLMARSLPEVMHGGHASTRAGAPYGELLLFLLSARACHKDYKPSITKGISILSERLQTTKAFASKRTLWRRWRQYKPVAHFHALNLLNRAEFDGEVSAENIPASAVLFVDDLLGYLSRAEKLRTLAEQFGIVKRGELWSVPADLCVPESDFLPPPLPAESLAALRTYRAAHSRKP